MVTKIIQQKKNVFNLQGVCFYDETKHIFQYGEFILLRYHPDYQTLCKIIEPGVKISNVCSFDESVIVLNENIHLLSSIPKITLLSDSLCDINVLQDYKVIDSYVEICKHLNITIVFESIVYVTKWKTDYSVLTQCVKDVLKFFTFVDNSVIFLNSFSNNQTLNIKCILIHETGHNESRNHLFKVGAGTKIKIVNIISSKKFEAFQNVFKSTSCLYGLENIFKSLNEVFSIAELKTSKLKLCNQVLLSGPSGCGKSSCLEELAKRRGFIILNLPATDIIDSTPGVSENNLKKVFDEAKEFAKNDEQCVILIDEIDILSTSYKQNHYVKRVLSKLCFYLEETHEICGIVVIGVTNKSEDVDKSLFRHNRLGYEIVINIPVQNERKVIIKNLFKQNKFDVISDEAIDVMSIWTNGYVRADLTLLINDVSGKFSKAESKTEVVLLSIFKNEVSNRTSSVHKSNIGLVTRKSTNLDDIGGLSDVKARLYTSIILPLLKPEPFSRLGVPTPKGVLLYGPPGCAKTTIVKALANETQMTFMAVTAAELYSPFVGDAEKKISLLFHHARLCAPSILFIDEIDGLVGSRWSQYRNNVQERVLSTLLVEMDGVGTKFHTDVPVIIVAATNRPDLLDDALKRPGRFDKVLYIRPPNYMDRLEILTKLTAKTPIDKSVDLKLLADVCEMYSGADLKNLCCEAALHSLETSDLTSNCVTMEDFTFVLKHLKPSLTSKQIQFYESF